MVSMVSSVVDQRFDPLSGETNDYIIGIYSFLAQHAALRSKTDWFSQNNVSEWSDM